MSSFTDYLKTDYATHFGVTWDDSIMSIRLEIPSSIRFEIEDKKVDIVQPNGQGVSVLRRPADAVEVVDLEDFTKKVHGENDTPSSCDFAISPCIGTDFLLLNELTRTKSDYIRPFVQPQTGIVKEGKLETAKQQLVSTINRLYEGSNFCDSFVSRVAIFSCRLSDKNKNGIMARSAKSFNKSIYKLQRMRLHETLPHGFVFEMRVYDQEFRIRTT